MKVTPMRIIPAHKPGVRIVHHSAQHTLTIGIYPGVTLSLPDRYIFLPVHPEGSAHRNHNNRHTFRDPEVSRRLLPMGYCRSEPHGLSPSDQRASSAVLTSLYIREQG